MPTTYNTDGSVTYSITLPAGIEVARQPEQLTYTAAGTTVAADWAQLNGNGWAEHIAALIAIRDAMQIDYAAEQQAKLDALASTLYAADVHDLPDPTPYAGLDDATAAGYRKRAAVLGSLGVSKGAGQ